MKMICFGVALTMGAAGSMSSAAIINPALSGTVQTDTWNFATVIDSDDYGTPFSTAAWDSPIISNIQGFTATFNKDSGYGYLSASGAIYALAPTAVANDWGADYTVAQSSVLPGVMLVDFQLDITESLGYDFHDGDSDGHRDFPVLSYKTVSNMTEVLMADQVRLVSQDFIGTFPDPDSGQDQPVYRNSWLIQWDLSQENSIADPIASFDIDWAVATHTWMYNARLDQSNTVPEPAILGLLAFGGLVLMRRR